MADYEFFLASTLEKVFPSRRPGALSEGAHLSAWRGTRAGVQLVYRVINEDRSTPSQPFQLEVSGAPCPCTMRRVDLIPSDFPCYPDTDDAYITKEPGLFPDLLSPMKNARILPLNNQYRSIWLSFEIPEDAAPGEYPVCITAKAIEKEICRNGLTSVYPTAAGLSFSCRFTLCVAKAQLPEQSLIHTEWFHCDSLAHYYHVKPLSEEHWAIIEKFIRAAGVLHGINMLLTPVFTPPLDTAVGGERMTVQLVDVEYNGGTYRFGFDKLHRWTALCRKYGIRYLEIAHLFTQWGAAATPKIMAAVNGTEQRIFGWDVPADSAEYRRFLCAFIPALRAELENDGYDREHVYFHISDEPDPGQADSYRAARAQLDGLLDGCPVIDALSSFEFYQKGLIEHPIPGTNHIEPFHEAKVPGLWTYYCCSQHKTVPNRFFAMESARNRIMGVLMYLYDIRGFLHWGYNFYGAQFSSFQLNPYCVTHADYAFPSGDAFLVYPGENGEPLSSVRVEVQDDALIDLRSLQLLESLAGRSFTEALIEQDAGRTPLSFTNYPHSADYLLRLREKVAAEIDKRI